MRNGVTLVIPSIPQRRRLLVRAFDSASRQTRPFDEIYVVVDIDARGGGPTRTRGMRTVRTEWTAFLDDDDELYRGHLDTLWRAAESSGADIIYPWFDVAGGQDPFPQYENVPWDPDEPHIFPITTLARTELLQASHGFPLTTDTTTEDWPLWQELFGMGAKVHHVPVRTWRWSHSPPGGNTSGRPDRRPT